MTLRGLVMFCPVTPVARFVPYVRSRGKDSGAEVVEPEAAVDQGVAGGEKYLSLGSGQFAVGSADAHMAVEAVRLVVLCRLSSPVE